MAEILSGLWKNITFVCGHGHETQVDMIYKEGDTMFYSCPRYQVSKERPLERACANRMAFKDAEEIVLKISKEIIDAEANGTSINLTNYKFTHKQIDVHIISHDAATNAMTVSVLNHKAIK